MVYWNMTEELCLENNALMREIYRRVELTDDYVAALEKRLRVVIGCWKQLEILKHHLEKRDNADNTELKSVSKKIIETEDRSRSGNAQPESGSEVAAGDEAEPGSVTDVFQSIEKVEASNMPEDISSEWSNYFRHVTSLSKTVVEIGYDLIKAAQFIPQLQVRITNN